MGNGIYIQDRFPNASLFPEYIIIISEIEFDKIRNRGYKNGKSKILSAMWTTKQPR